MALLACGVAAAVGIRAASMMRGASFVVRAANLQGTMRQVAEWGTTTEAEHLVTMQLPSGPIRGRAYVPAGRSRQTVLLIAGLHPAGIDEPRLIALARELARTHVTVVTPDIPELMRFEITPVLTDRIEQAAAWLARTTALAPEGRIGLMGISFSGGLSVVAAARPSLRDRLLYVFALGGHDDLPRVLRYLCGGPDLADTGVEAAPPQDYGVAVVLLNVADDLVPPEQAAPLRAAVQRFVWASYIEGIDPVTAKAEFQALRDIAGRMPPPSAALLDLINNRDVARLGPLLLPHIDRHVQPPALSPSKSPPPAAPVFLLHGRLDSVIPSRESRHLAARLQPHVPVRLLLTDLVSHAEADRPAQAADVLRLVLFWDDLLRQ